MTLTVLCFRFLSTGGWGILNKWLLEFTKSENFPVLLELIDVCSNLINGIDNIYIYIQLISTNLFTMKFCFELLGFENFTNYC